MIKFTSESVSEGHPDKIADQISDAILDVALAKDQDARIACETMIKNSLVIVSGEISTTAVIDVAEIAGEVIKSIGYDDSSLGLDYKNISVINLISQQSQEIKQSVFDNKGNCIGAGDQGIMFGYACNETNVCMPAAIYFAHKLLLNLKEARKSKSLAWLGPDAKCQVTVQYNNDQLSGIDNILISTQHKADITHEQISFDIVSLIKQDKAIHPYLNSNTRYIINPSGSFVIGGPRVDCGLTGRKIIADTYGSYGRHGGGAFSGKDPSKVDRSAAYMARYIAKNIVAAGLARKCEIQLAYGIGLPEPLSVSVNTFGTSALSEKELIIIIMENFELRPGKIIKYLKLKTITYRDFTVYGHFGREELNLPWEARDKVELLQKFSRYG